MNKGCKAVVIVLIVIAGLIIFSPFISLLLPQKLTNHTYYRLLYHVIVDKETRSVFSEDEKVSKLFDYAVNHEFGQGAPYKCKPAESLIYAEAYCDFQARTLNALLGIAGIKSRYAMLLDKDGISPHTLNEVFLDGKWCVFDTAINVIFTGALGDKLTLEDLSENPNLIYSNEKMAALKNYNKDEYTNVASVYSRVIPIPAQPRRSTPIVYQNHVFDYVADMYFKIFRYRFFNLYQGLYLKFKTGNFKSKDARVFFWARNYHLAYRRSLALKYYSQLESEFPEGTFAKDGLFFIGMLNFEKNNLEESVKSLNVVLAEYPQKWRAPANYYLGMIYGALGDKENSLKAYANSAIYRLSATTLRQLQGSR